MAEQKMIPLVTIIVLLVAVGIGAFVYFNVTEVGEMSPVTDRFTGLTNASDTTVTLSFVPYSSGEFAGTWYNSSSAAWASLSAGMYTYSGQTPLLKTLNDNDGLNMTACNLTYTTQAGVMMRDHVQPTAGTVFTLAPIIAVVMIAAVILGIIMGFGKREV